MRYSLDTAAHVWETKTNKLGAWSPGTANGSYWLNPSRQEALLSTMELVLIPWRADGHYLQVPCGSES